MQKIKLGLAGCGFLAHIIVDAWRKGPLDTRVVIRSVLGYQGDDHRIEVRGEEVHAVVDIYSRTRAIAGWSVVALLRNLVAPIAF